LKEELGAAYFRMIELEKTFNERDRIAIRDLFHLRREVFALRKDNRLYRELIDGIMQTIE